MKTANRLPRRILFTVLTLAVVGMGASSAHAASVYFLQIGDIKGESTDKNHKDWIDINSFSWGISNTGSVGSGGGGSAGKAIISPLSWTQDLDASVSHMYLGVASGTHYPKATLDVQQVGTKLSDVYFQMVFEDVMLSSLNINGAGDHPSASGSLVYSKLTMTYRPQKADGSLGAPIVGGWDLKKNVAADAFFGSPDVLQGLILAGGPSPSAVPVPAAVWLFGSGLLGLIGFVRRSARRQDR
jgi:type VI protein secretion system component Hcp